MTKRFTRRKLIKGGAALAGGIVLSTGMSSLTALADFSSPAPTAAAGQMLPWYALSADHGDDCSCSSCNACARHAANKLFISPEAADANRAHVGCMCKVVQGGVLPETTWVRLFGSADAAEREQVDRRWSWAAKTLSA